MIKFNDIYNKKPIEFVLKPKYNKLNEDVGYVPRFSLKELDIFKNIPVNEPIKFSEELIIKAIQYGMILSFEYKGQKDKHFAGHERTILPMVYGRSSKGKLLIRGFHLRGWSVSSNRHVEKIWRLFRADRVLSVTFTGSFFRLPPDGYVQNDSIMRGGIVAYADFNQIRKNQTTLLKSQSIQNKEEVTLSGGQTEKFVQIKVENTKTIMDLTNAFDNEYISKVKDLKNLRLSFLKSVYGNKYLVVLGAAGDPNNTVKVLDEKGRVLGVYRVLDSINGDKLKKIKNVKGNKLYDVVIFQNKI